MTTIHDDTTLYCDTCDAPCATPHGDPDRAVGCCVCLAREWRRYAPLALRDRPPEPCARCAERALEHAA